MYEFSRLGMCTVDLFRYRFNSKVFSPSPPPPTTTMNIFVSFRVPILPFPCSQRACTKQQVNTNQCTCLRVHKTINSSSPSPSRRNTMATLRLAHLVKTSLSSLIQAPPTSGSHQRSVTPLMKLAVSKTLPFQIL